MKIATWNVNSIKIRVDQVLRWVEGAKPDVLCLQEIKVVEGAFPYEAFAGVGYHAAVAGQRTYNGVAILSRSEPGHVTAGLAHLPPDHPQNAQARIIAATVGGVRVISVYLPNGEAVGSEKFAFKLDFFRELRRYFDLLHRPDELLALCGDFNVAPEPRDLYNPEDREGQLLFSREEREALEAVRGFGFTDCFRLHCGEAGRYTWWDYQGGMYWKGLGIRLDHLWATAPLAARCTSCEIDEKPRRWKRPSDHTVVWAEFDMERNDDISRIS